MTTGGSKCGVLVLKSAMLAAWGLCACTTTVKQNSPGVNIGGPSLVNSGEQDAGVDAGTQSFPPCVEPDAGVPADVFCTGLYKGHNATKYESGPMPYTPGVVLWSDGAEKQRYLYLPPGTQIDNTNMDVWNFPVGTKAWKEFRFDGKLVETRLFWKRSESSWDYGTYIWDADQKTGTLNTSKQPVLLPSGYEIPTAKDCERCHHGGADRLLGVEAVALALPTTKGVTLATLMAAGALTRPLSLTSITLPEDSTGRAGDALGYLHANCGMPCHSNRGLGHDTELIMRLRGDEFWPATGDATIPPATMTDTYKATVGQMAVTGAVTAAFPDALRITPGAHDKSLVWMLPDRRGDYQMPPLVSHKVDDVGTQKLQDWIDALAPQ